MMTGKNGAALLVWEVLYKLFIHSLKRGDCK